MNFDQLFPHDDFAILAIVLLLPALGAFVNGVFGKRLGRDGVRLMALACIGGAFVASLATFLSLPHAHGDEPGRLSWTAWHWFSVNGRVMQSIPIDVAFSVDGMSATMMLIITGVGFLIHLYSTEYMHDDPGFHRFFAYLNLFCFAMLVLVMADNMALLFVGWEGVGLCSYLLIGFWFDVEKNASAGKKAFIVNRIGDFGLLLAMAMLIYYSGSLQWTHLSSNTFALLQPVKIWPIGNLSEQTLPHFLAQILIPAKPVHVYASTLIGLAIFLGCAGKSAQIPLYIWLPDAMAGPTPVSALIHAATMVTAGVYLVARTSAIFLMSPAAMAVVACAGAATAIFAASIGLLQYDIKKVLAYSTVSQLGFMFIGVGVGAFAAGFFHVVTHAFFKACLFLGAGSVIHAMHARIHDGDKSQDMRNMGGLRHYLPYTRWTFLISCLAIAGAPPLSGFWSKDEILWKAFSNEVHAPSMASGADPMWTWPDWLHPLIYWVGIIAATMTAFYMFRAYFMTFHGRFNGWKIVKGWKAPKHEHHEDEHAEGAEAPLPQMEGPVPRESPYAMTVPLMVLAAFAAFAGFFMAEPIHVAPLGHLLEPLFDDRAHHVTERAAAEGKDLVMMLPGIAAFLAGTVAAAVVYWNRHGAPELEFKKSWPRLYALVYDKWRIDELYDATVVGMVDALADIFTMADKWIVDGILARVSAALVAAFGTILRAFQSGRVQAYAASMVLGLAGFAWFFVAPHADAKIDDSKLRDEGVVTITAEGGPGYAFFWKGTGDADSKQFSPSESEVKVKLGPGERKDVSLDVRNAFNNTTHATFVVFRPSRKGPTEVEVPAPADMPQGTIPGSQIPDLIRGGR